LVMSDSEHFTVSYTSISSDSDPSAWGILLMDADEVPEIDPYEEVSQQGQVAPPSPAYAPDTIELEDHVPMYAPDPEEDLEEDPDEDPVDYAADADNDEEEEEESSKDEEEEEGEEHLAPADSTAVASPGVDPIPSAEEIELFETDEYVATPPTPPAYPTTLRMYVRSQAPIPFPSKAEIPSPPLLIPSIAITSPTYTKAPLGYRVDRIRLRAASPLPLPAPSTSRRADILEADILPQKRLLLTAPIPRFEVGESSVAVAARQSGSTMACGVDYNFMDTMDASIQALERRTMAAIEMVNLRVDTLRRYISSLCTTHKQERVEARQAFARSEAHNRAFEAQIAVLETQARHYEWRSQDANDHATGAMMCIQVMEGRARIDTLEDTGSSS
ncbi:hypothetical protein Tco_0736287, partial [Tanacetum coccineum]